MVNPDFHVDAAHLCDNNLIFLIVEDDNRAREKLAESLRSFGFTTILEAVDGDQALSMLEHQRVDFIISDWEMPQKNGMELLKSVRENPNYKLTPFIMITRPVRQDPAKVEQAANADVDGYLFKPYRSEILSEKIRTILARIKMKRRNGALVTDKDDETRAIVGKFLSASGYSPIFEAKDVSEATALVKACSPEIAFVACDVELVKSIPQLKAKPFVALVYSETAVEEDIEFRLRKPLRPEELKLVMGQAIVRAKSEMHSTQELGVGLDFLEKQSWNEAAKVFKKMLDVDTNHIEANLGIARAATCLVPESAIPNAVPFIRKVISLNPKYAQAHIDLALTFEGAMSLDKAIGSLRESLVECPFNEGIHYHLGRLLLRRGLEKEAMQELALALQINPQHAAAFELFKKKRLEKRR